MPTARFAPSTTGPAHPGTLLAALLCWLDARHHHARLLLRLEDLDPERCRPIWRDAMQEALAWLGLDWDGLAIQSLRSDAHEAALDRLAAQDRLYPCRCSRREIREQGWPLADGGFAYPGTCRGRALPPEGWRSTSEPLRVRLSDETLSLTDEGGRDLSGAPARDPGDPVVRRRDGAVAYHLAGVVDDGDAGVTRVVRGHDLAATTPTQVALQRLLEIPTPTYRHHLLLLEERGAKLAKFHGAVGYEALRDVYSPDALCGFLAWTGGLQPEPEPTTPGALLTSFSWQRVATRDRVVRWTGSELQRIDLPAT